MERLAVPRSSAQAAKPQRSLRGAFITFEGIDGCGKTTQARLLSEKLRSFNFPVVETREPGGTEIGRHLRAIVLDPQNVDMTPSCELLVYLADRVQHLAQVIRPALARGDTVVCDRYHDATVAYQHHGRGLDFAPLRELIAAEIEPTPPVTTFWLDLDIEPAQARIAQRAADPEGGATPEALRAGRETRLEREDIRFHLRVMLGYEQICKAEPERVIRIDASAPVEAIQQDIWGHIGRRFHVI